MSGRRIVAACAVLALCEACGSDRRGGWDWERMREQPRYDVYERSRFFADGKVMQQPPAGTVPLERTLGEPLVTDGGIGEAPATSIPVPVTAALLATGQSRFHIYCAACHGAGGYGGSVVAQNMDPPRPPSLRAAAARALPPGYVYRVIRDGFGRMPPFAGQLPVMERWAVIAYLHQVQGRGAEGAEEQLDSTRAAELRRIDAGGRFQSGAARPPSAPAAGATP